MSIIEEKARAIANDMAGDEPVKVYAIDPFTITTIATVLIEVVKAVYQCYQNREQVANAMQNPGLMERWRLRRIIRDKVDDEEAHGVLGGRMFRSALKVARSVTPEEVEQMHAEATSG